MVVSAVKVCHSGRLLVAIAVASHCGHCHGHGCGRLKGFRAQPGCFDWASSPVEKRNQLLILQSPDQHGEKLELPLTISFGNSKRENVTML